MSAKKFNIEDYLHAIDTKLKDKSKKDLYMIYIMIAASIFAFSYLLFWDMSLKSFEKKIKQTEEITRKIDNDKIFLKFNTPQVVAALDKKIKAQEEKYIEYKDYNAYIKTKLEQIPFLLYDETVWGDFLNSIDKKALRYHVKLLNLSNDYTQTGAAFGHVLDIALSLQGKYKNTLLFLNALETSDLVVDVHDINISTTPKKKLVSDLNISVWGIRY